MKKTVQRSKRCVSPQPPVPVALPLLALLEALFGDIALHTLSEVWVAVHCPVCALGQALCCAAGEQFCTQTPHPFHFTVLPMWAHTHTHTYAHSFPAFPHYLSALNCTQIWFWARHQKCNTRHLLLVLALHSQCTGVYATVMSHTSTLNSPSPPFPNKNIDLLLPFVIPPPF